MKNYFFVLFTLCFVALISCNTKNSENSDNLEDINAVDVNHTETDLDQKLPIIIDFSAVWCPPCQQFKPIFEEASKDYTGKVEFKTIDVDENSEMAKSFNISSIPAIVFIDSNGNEVNRIVGFVDRNTLDKAIEEYFKVKI